MTNITKEHRHKNPQQNISKVNPIIQGSYTMIQVGLIQECKDFSLSVKQSL